MLSNNIRNKWGKHGKVKHIPQRNMELRKVWLQKGGKRLGVSPSQDDFFRPKKRQDELSQDLLNFAAESLRDKGRLVFLVAWR